MVATCKRAWWLQAGLAQLCALSLLHQPCSPADLFYDEGRKCISRWIAVWGFAVSSGVHWIIVFPSKPMYWINFTVSYQSHRAGRRFLPGLCRQRACVMEQKSIYYPASPTTNRVAFLVGTKVNPGRAPVWSAMPQDVSDNPNRKEPSGTEMIQGHVFIHRDFQLTPKVDLCSEMCLRRNIEHVLSVWPWGRM